MGGGGPPGTQRQMGGGQGAQMGQAPAGSAVGQSPGGMGGARGSPGMPGAHTVPQLQMVTVEDIVQTDVVTADPDTPIRTVVAKMAEEDVGCVVVVDEERPIGVITDRKVALALEETPDLSERTAEELVSDDLITGRTDMNLFQVVQQFNEATIRRLPIVDEDETLIGILTLDDVLVVLGTELHNAVEVIKAQSPRM